MQCVMKTNANFGFISLYTRKGNELVRASKEDISTATNYVFWKNKGNIIEGCRVTIMSKKESYSCSEEIRIIHVLEVLKAGYLIYINGPKQVSNEFVNDEPYTGKIDSRQEDPFKPDTYNGRIVESPGIDYNFEITSYRFKENGIYNICWSPGKWKSNVLEIEVK